MTKKVRIDLANRMKLRIKGEAIIERYFEHILTNRDINRAKEWNENETLTIYEEKYEVVCNKKGFFSLEGQEFSYLFYNLNSVCESLLLES